MGAKRKSKKDQVVPVDLLELIPEEIEERADYEGAKLNLRLVAPEVARDWAIRQRKIMLENKRRRLEANKDFEIYGEKEFTEQSLEELSVLQAEIITASVAGMGDIEGVGERDQEGALEEIAYIGIEQEVANKAQEIQSLSARQRFRAARSRRRGDAADTTGSDG